MKNRKAIFTFLLLSFLFISKASAQLNNDLVVFCNDGYKFTLILNGQRYNDTPQNRVKATSLNLKSYAARVIFENPKIKDINTTITFHNNGYECVFALNSLSRKKYHFVYVSSTLINPDDAPAVDKSSNYDDSNNSNTNTYSSPDYTSTNTTPNTSTNTTTNSGNTSGISLNTGKINIGVNEQGKINIGGNGANVNMDTKNPSGNISVTQGGQTIALNKAPKTGCSSPMNTLQFEAVKKEITSDTTNAGNLSKAKSSLTNCFTTSQVKEVMVLFSDDNSKLEFAKNAYEHTNDLNNYTSLKNTFASEEKKEEFSKFVKSMK